ncbi:hypothetical protein PQX77_015804 [Marasmius sp. AFHP31]|nr:hypothetical protein PQX77_015804 [Marasmius sp. AFHP31]
MPVQDLQVDDTDPTIAYTPSDGWSSGRCKNAYNGTCHSVSNSGARLQFMFRVDYTGTSIEVFGANNLSIKTSNNGPSSVLYTLDNSTTENILPNTANGSLFQSIPLNSGVHNLIITIASITDDHRYMFDYFAIHRPASVATTSARSSTTTFLIAPAETSTPSEDGPSRKADVGAIIGWSVAAVMALLAITVFLLLRNHNRKHKEIHHQSDSLQSMTITPFSLYQSPSKSKPEASSISFPPVPPPTPITATLALGLDPNPMVLPPSLPISTGHVIPASVVSGNSNGTTLPCYTSRVGTLPPIPDPSPPPAYA